MYNHGMIVQFIQIQISTGKHDWKIKMIAVRAAQTYIGIASNMAAIDGYFYGLRGGTAKNGGFCYAYTEDMSMMTRRMSHEMGGSERWPEDNSITLKSGDIFTIHLDLDKRTVGWSINDHFIGNAFKNVEQASYRLVITVECHSIFEFIQ